MQVLKRLFLKNLLPRSWTVRSWKMMGKEGLVRLLLGLVFALFSGSNGWTSWGGRSNPFHVKISLFSWLNSRRTLGAPFTDFDPGKWWFREKDPILRWSATDLHIPQARWWLICHPSEKYYPPEKLTYATLGKGKSSSKCHFWRIC